MRCTVIGTESMISVDVPQVLFDEGTMAWTSLPLRTRPPARRSVNLAHPLISGGKVSEAISTLSGCPGCLVDSAKA
jgi:hypothetical protein